MPLTTANPRADRRLRSIRPADALCWAAQLFIGGMALFLFALAIGMNRRWTDHHLLPDILVPSNWLVTIVQIERFILITIAIALLLAVHRIRARRGAAVWRGLVIGMAVLLALPASELFMQLASGRRGQAWNPTDKPLRMADPLIGWTYIPSRGVADNEYAWRPSYFVDSHGYRVAADGVALDLAAPSVLFVGESIMFGKGLNWHDTVAAHVQALSGIQSANLAVNAYSLSQGFLHLQRELPKFRQPVAIVILFAPSLMVRDLDRNRPWIDSGGRWHRASPTWALGHLGRVLFPYHSTAAIAEAVASDRRVLKAEAAMARARGAEPLILVPVFQPEQRRERALRRMVFDGLAVPHLVVPLDQSWRLVRDSHPDARGDAVMARALWTGLGEPRIPHDPGDAASRPELRSNGRR
ncbi:hypothetical protein [Rhizorhabdus argentea]|uniref:hypothetical protein n=1 Tax=Rhizorhabdus argentea TaxID=1387174 RepID=UPI0030EB5930